jgi:sigma-E factor negative regulatory protein RseC
MSAGMIEHRGIIQRVEGGKAIIAMETAGCSSCGQGSSCGIGKMASGRPATLLTLPVSGDLKAGDFVLIGLPESKLTFSALLGYLFPAFAMIFGAWLGAALDGSDGATALGEADHSAHVLTDRRHRRCSRHGDVRDLSVVSSDTGQGASRTLVDDAHGERVRAAGGGDRGQDHLLGGHGTALVATVTVEQCLPHRVQVEHEHLDLDHRCVPFVRMIWRRVRGRGR